MKRGSEHTSRVLPSGVTKTCEHLLLSGELSSAAEDDRRLLTARSVDCLRFVEEEERLSTRKTSQRSKIRV